MASIFLNKGVTDLGTLASLNTNDLIVAEGGQTVISGLDQSALAAAVANIYNQGQSTVGMGGGSAGYLKCSITGMILLGSFGGSWYYTPVGTGSTTTCARLKTIAGNSTYINGGGTVLKLECSGSSYTYVGDTSLVTTLTVCSGATVEQLYNATANTSWYINGTLTTGRGWSGTARLGANAVVYVSREDSSATAPTGGTLEMGGGSFTWRGGNITTINATSGFLDFRDVPAAMTITNLTVTRDVLRRSYFRGANFTVTITNLTVLGDQGDVVVQ